MMIEDARVRVLVGPSSSLTGVPASRARRSAPTRWARKVAIETIAADTKKCSITTHGLRSVQDRKSTRLNSSHVAISYAVFCLKKKGIVKRVRLVDIECHHDLIV